MARMAVVGCEGSGKTVFMAALADYYRPSEGCDVCLVPENAASNRFAAFQQRQMRALHQWPPATNPEKTVRLDWSLRHGGETLVEIGMLEFGGETFRAAFRGDAGEEARASAVEELLAYLSDVDIVVVLVSIKDLMLDQKSLSSEEFERDAEALWVTRGILDFVLRKRSTAGIVIGLTRADQYRAELDAAGGAKALFSARWPTVGAAAAKIPIVEVASVSAVDESGMPAEGFRTDGVLPAMREVSKLHYGDVKDILAELAALRDDLGRSAGRAFVDYSDLLRKFSGRFDDLKAAAAISGVDVADEAEGFASSLERFRAESEALAREEDRRLERRRHPRVRRCFLVAFLFAAALFAVSPILPLDRLIAKVAERIEQSRWNVVAVPPPAETNAAAAVAMTNAPPTVLETNAAPVVAETNVVAEVAETNAVPVAVETNVPPVSVATNAVPSVVAETNVAPPVVAATNAPSEVATPVKTAEEPPRKESARVVATPMSVDKALVVFSNRLERAKAGDLRCKRWLGNQYYKGTDAAPRNLVMARHWYREAAEGGDARAQACMGAMCEYGEGGPLLPSEAMSWYRKAAEGGVAEAMFRLGINLWEGAVDDPEAAREAYDWMLKAKAAGCRNEDLDAWIRKATPRDR